MLIFSIWCFTETSKNELNGTLSPQNLVVDLIQQAEQPNQTPALIDFGENENVSQESRGMSQYFIK